MSVLDTMLLQTKLTIIHLETLCLELLAILLSVKLLQLSQHCQLAVFVPVSTPKINMHPAPHNNDNSDFDRCIFGTWKVLPQPFLPRDHSSEHQTGQPDWGLGCWPSACQKPESAAELSAFGGHQSTSSDQ